jgi:AraC-like DNA-binding protein
MVMLRPDCAQKEFEGGAVFHSSGGALVRTEEAGDWVRLGLLEAGSVWVEGERGLFESDASRQPLLFWAGAGESYGLTSLPGREPVVRGVVLRREFVDGLTREALGRASRVRGVGQRADPQAARALRAFHQGLWDGGEGVAWQGWLELALVRFVDPAAAARAPGYESAGVRRAREYLHANAGSSISLDALASAARLGRFQLWRAFSKELGRSPHEYLRRLRLARALKMLRSGVPAAETALRLGFADQSHFTRVFRAEFGTTPARYARG